MLSALAFAKPLTHEGAEDGFGFGMDGARAAAALRELADKIEQSKVLLQSARVTSLASGDDYALTGLRLVIAERAPVKLYGHGNSAFPVEIAHVQH